MEGGYGSLGNNSGKQEIRPISRKTKVIVLTVIAVIVIGLAGFTIYEKFFDFEKIDLMKGIEPPTVAGYSGTGYVEGVNDEGYLDAVVKENAKTEAGARFLETVSYKVDKVNGLNNGDTLVVKAVYDEEGAKEAKIKVTNDTLQCKVDGLIERFANGEELKNTVGEEGVSTAVNMLQKYVIDNHSGMKVTHEKTYFSREDGEDPEKEYQDYLVCVFRVKDEYNDYHVWSSLSPINKSTEFGKLRDLIADGALEANECYGGYDSINEAMQDFEAGRYVKTWEVK